MQAEAEAPCTVGNCGPGFDVLSLALERRGDRARLTMADEDAVRVTGPGADRIPGEWPRNAACAAVDALRARTGLTQPLLLELEKGMPPGSGLGSSASSSAAAIHAFARLFNLKLSAHDALAAAGVGESLATGGVHYDDVAAALFGGLAIVGGEGPDAVLRLRPPGVHLVVVRPDVDLPTREMRRLLPDAIPRADVVHNLSNVARIVHACHTQDAAMFCRALDDRIAKPYRAPKVPLFSESEKAARAAGAQAYLLSGSGPTSIAVLPDTRDPQPVAAALRDVWTAGGMPAEVFLTRPLQEVNHAAVPLS